MTPAPDHFPHRAPGDLPATAEVDPQPTEPPVRGWWRRIPLWLVAFLGFFLLGAGWGIAAPWNGGPDEPSHVAKAVSVYWDGPWPKPVDAWRGTGTVQHVPSVFTSGDLAGPPGPRVPTAVYTGRYNAAYFAIVGWRSGHSGSP